MSGSETTKQKAERGVKLTQEFLAHLQERLAYYEACGDGDHAAAIRHIMVGVTKLLTFEQNTAPREEDEPADD